MADEPSRAQVRLAFGRAFLLHLRRGDLAKATLFARAFVVQVGTVNGPRPRDVDR